MNDKLVSVNHGQLVTDSRKVAAHFNKRHDHVIRDIGTLVGGLPKNGDTQRMFYKTSYINAQNGQTYPMYLMNRDGFSLLVMGFTGKAALEWKLKFLEAFNTMEKALREQQAVPKITPNPHYRTRMIKTAVKDIGDTADTIAQVFHVKKGIAMTASMQMVGEAYGIDTEPLKKLVPPEANPAFLTPTKIAAELNVLTNTRKASAATGTRRKKGRSSVKRCRTLPAAGTAATSCSGPRRSSRCSATCWRKGATEMEERVKKQEALHYLERALGVDDKWFSFRLSDDGNTVKVTDLESNCTRDVNITLDNVPAMIYDILRQAKDWIM